MELGVETAFVRKKFWNLLRTTAAQTERINRFKLILCQKLHVLLAVHPEVRIWKLFLEFLGYYKTTLVYTT